MEVMDVATVGLCKIPGLKILPNVDEAPHKPPEMQMKRDAVTEKEQESLSGW